MGLPFEVNEFLVTEKFENHQIWILALGARCMCWSF